MGKSALHKNLSPWSSSQEHISTSEPPCAHTMVTLYTDSREVCFWLVPCDLWSAISTEYIMQWDNPSKLEICLISWCVLHCFAILLKSGTGWHWQIERVMDGTLHIMEVPWNCVWIYDETRGDPNRDTAWPAHLDKSWTRPASLLSIISWLCPAVVF